MMRRFLSSFTIGFPATIAYMLQSTEYDRSAYLDWLHTVKDFRDVMNRRALERTSVARAFVLFVRLGVGVQLLIGFLLSALSVMTWSVPLMLIGIATILSAPLTWAHLVVVPLAVARHHVLDKRTRKYHEETRRIMMAHKGVKIAVAGSFGKTTMKELLATVLSESKVVAATPGNKNVTAAHYDFAKQLSGDEEILIVEFGEGRPGDVERFTQAISPDIAIITGIAPAHLDHYADVDDAASDIFTVARSPKAGNVYVNGDSDYVKKRITQDNVIFTSDGLDGWKVNDSYVDLSGTHFTLSKSDVRLQIDSGLIGKHLIGVLAATAVIAMKVGVSKEQVQAGMKKTLPYEHRMQPYQIGGAWIIDDSYNGNLQGIKAGTELLGSLNAKRKIYVTPGLVDQGGESAVIHQTIGRYIAEAEPDVVVLMKNSVTNDIVVGLRNAGFEKQLIIQSDPLSFYTNLDQFVARGDIVLLQNDWTDNYR